MLVGLGLLAVVISLFAAYLLRATWAWWLPSAASLAVAVVLLSRGDPTSHAAHDDAAIRLFGVGGLLYAPILLATSWRARGRAAAAGRARS